jgi:hypothetical protein
VLVDGDHTRYERMWGVEHLTEEALSRVGITRGAQHEVQRRITRVDCPIEVAPLLLDLDVRFLDAG